MAESRPPRLDLRALLFGARGVHAEGAEPPPSKDPLSASNMMRLVKGLALNHQDRVFGTPKGERAAKWLADQMKQAGLLPGNGDSYFQPFTQRIGGEDLTGRNVVGMIPGSDPALKDEAIIVTAHYDVVESTHQGANDNATGCAGVLAIAKALKDNPPKRTVVFMTFDGEEGLRRGGTYFPGRKGSRFYAANPLFPLAKTALMVNMDELGMVHLETQSRDLIYQWASSDGFAQTILKQATKKTDRLGKSVDGYPEQPQEAQFFTTDAEPLYRLGVPVINFLSGRYLLNHTEQDDLSLMIPERMEQYVRRAFACVSEAASHPTPVKDFGVAPGGLMPTYPLVRERRGQATGVTAEENLRLNGFLAKMPALRDASSKLRTMILDQAFLARLEAKTGLRLPNDPQTFWSEPTLAKVREHRARMLETYRDIPKGDTQARRAALEGPNLLSGVESVLSGGLYLSLIQGGDYYLQQVPDRLLELRRGAIRLGRGYLVKDLITADDTRKFTAEVSADRAVALAKESLPGLEQALSQAVYALVDPERAAANERPVASEDLRALEVAMTEAARSALGDADDKAGDLKRLALGAAFLDATIGKLKGTGDKWLGRFAALNAMTDFAGTVRALDLPPDRTAEILRSAARVEENILPPVFSELKEAVGAFYGALTEAVFGQDKRADSIEALAELSKDKAIERLTTEAAQATDRQAIARAAGDPAVERLTALEGVLSSTLRLRQLFRTVDRGRRVVLDEASTLHEVMARIDDTRASLAKLGGAEAVLKELEFWSRWLSAFVDLEPAAEGQARLRREAAADGLRALEALWRDAKPAFDPNKYGIDIGRTESLGAVHSGLVARIYHLEQRDPPERDPRVEAALRRVGPLVEAANALQRLFGAAEPDLAKKLVQATEQIANQVGEAKARDLLGATQKLAELEATKNAELGRKERSGPLGVLSLRIQPKRNDP